MSIFKNFSRVAVTAGLICTAAAFWVGAREIFQTWDCGPSEDPGAVTGTLYADSTFIVSGKGNMRSIGVSSQVPWNNAKGRIKEVIIEDGVTSIMFTAFTNSANLTAVTIPGSVTEINGNTFDNCGKLTSVTIGEGVTKIGYNAFRNSASLETIEIPGSVTHIENMVFTDSPNLKSVTIGAGLTTIGDGLFWNCTKLETIIIRSQTPPAFEGNMRVGLGAPASANIYVPDMSIEAYRTAEEWNKYSNYAPVSTAPVVWPKVWNCGANVTCALDGGIFIVRGAGAMADYIPGGITVLQRAASAGVAYAPWENYKSYITGVVIGDHVTSVGNAAFYGSGNLTSVKIGRGVTSIGAFAFQNTSIDSIHIFSAEPPAVQTSTFTGVDLTAASLFVPPASMDAYAEVNGWGDFQDIRSNATTSVQGGVTVNRNRANSQPPVVSVRGKVLNVQTQSQQSSTSTLQIRMIDMRGKTILSHTANGGGAVSLSKVPAGRYVVDVRQSGVSLGSTAIVVR